MENDIKRQLKALRIYCACLTLMVTGLLLLAFRSGQKNNYDEISVQRLNVVDAAGHLSLAIGSKGKLPGPTMNGKEFSKQRRGSGMILYNEDGDECGGYMWGSEKNGGAGAIFTFDQYKQDAIVSLNYQEAPGPIGGPKKNRFAGLVVSPQPTALAEDELVPKYEEARKIKDTARRSEELKKLDRYFNSNSLFVGKKRNDDMGIFITDAKQRPRLKLYTDKGGNPRLEFIDSLGKVQFALPQKQ